MTTIVSQDRSPGCWTGLMTTSWPWDPSCERIFILSVVWQSLGMASYSTPTETNLKRPHQCGQRSDSHQENKLPSQLNVSIDDHERLFRSNRKLWECKQGGLCTFRDEANQTLQNHTFRSLSYLGTASSSPSFNHKHSSTDP